MLICSTDKNPHLSEFVSQIKTTPELQLIFDSIQKDSTGPSQDTSLMDLSWVGCAYRSANLILAAIILCDQQIITIVGRFCLSISFIVK